MVSSSQAVRAGSLEVLCVSWRRHLQAAGLSPNTVKTYMEAASQLLDFLEENGMPTEAASIRREHVEAFIVHLLAARSASTAATRYRGLQQLFGWLTDEGEIPTNPMARMRPPQLEERAVPVVPPEDLRALVAACNGPGFEDRRDTALVLFLLDTGARLAEAAGLALTDLDLDAGVALVVGKGRRERALVYSPKVTKALDRYLRTRGGAGGISQSQAR
jgi:site-specific recombinase XerD